MIAMRKPSRDAKAASGIRGFDEITNGGLPRGRVTVVAGTAGAGKTVFAAQALAHGIAAHAEPGLFVTFEETPARILAAARSFKWKLGTSKGKTLEFFDARLSQSVLNAGEFDLVGLLGLVSEKVRQQRAQRIVFDGIDMLLASGSKRVASRASSPRRSKTGPGSPPTTRRSNFSPTPWSYFATASSTEPGCAPCACRNIEAARTRATSSRSPSPTTGSRSRRAQRRPSCIRLRTSGSRAESRAWTRCSEVGTTGGARFSFRARRGARRPRWPLRS